MSLIFVIQNDGTGSNECSNYDWRVLVNTYEIASGNVRGHRRTDGWQALIKKALDSCPFEPRTVSRRIALQTMRPLYSNPDQAR
jgi:hypothetical protein